MVQVDVFWSFALGAGFAAAASRQIKAKMDIDEFDILENKYFTKSLLFLSILFAPSGVLLLWGHTSWETMHFWNTHESLSKWIVVLFAITNVTQGVLGFWVASLFIRQGKYYEACLLMMVGYFLMFFILVHGWDGLGYRRFFTDTGEQWLAGNDELGLWLALKWLFTAKVAYSLYVLGIALVPLLLYMTSSWIKEGYEIGEVDRERASRLTLWDISKELLILIFGCSLGLAIMASLLIHILGWIIGTIVFAILGFVFLVRRGGLCHRAVSRVTLEEI